MSGYFAVSETVVICPWPKVATTSINAALGGIPNSQVTAKEAVDNYPIRIGWYRDHIERINSTFKMVWWGRHNNSNMSSLVPIDVIRAYGLKVSGFRSDNPHHWTSENEAHFQATVSQLRDENPRIEDADLTLLLNQIDYENYINYILKADRNPHWEPQTSLSMDNGVFVPNKLLRFENIGADWAKYVGGLDFPHRNIAPAVQVSPYKVSELDDLYVDDIAMRAIAL